MTDHNLIINSMGVVTGRGDCDRAGADIIIPVGAKEIGARLFAQGSIRSVVIPEGVTKIGQSAFAGCVDMVSVTIPASVVEIADDAFDQCFHVAKWAISPDNPYYKKNGSFIYTDNGAMIFRAAVRLEGSLTIPAGVKKINTSAFDYCKITEVYIPEGVEQIGKRAFGATALKTVDLPSSLEAIGAAAFSDCYQLASISIPSSVKNVGDGAFRNCPNLKEIIVLSENVRLHQSILALADLPLIPNAEVPILAPHLPFALVPTKLKLNALLGFSKMYRQGTEMDSAVRARYLKYIRTRGKLLEEATLRHDDLAFLLRKEGVLV